MKPAPLDPREMWHKDPRLGVVFGLGVGSCVGLISGLTATLSDDPVSEIKVGLVVGLTAALAFGITVSKTWPIRLACLQLWASGQLPLIRLMPFLEDARNRGVLRTLGPVYQFRHATLQDHLSSTSKN